MLFALSLAATLGTALEPVLFRFELINKAELQELQGDLHR
jgi:hypothetical protein